MFVCFVFFVHDLISENIIFHQNATNYNATEMISLTFHLNSGMAYPHIYYVI